MGQPARQLNVCRAVIAVCAACAAACSVLPASDTPASDARTSSEPASATETLLIQSRTARDSGDFAAAAAAIERALRIEPNDASLWLEYARLRLAGGDREQAATLAEKAASLAGDDRSIRDAALRLQADARAPDRP
jgi:Flp pilus assembly protein TadD